MASRLHSSITETDSQITSPGTITPDPTNQNFSELLRGLDDYIDELAPYHVDASQTIFPKLPAELRAQIYSYLLPERQVIIDREMLWALANLPRYPLFGINVSTRIDAGLYLICRCSFWVDHADSREELSAFLESFPGKQGFGSVRRIRFFHFSEEVPIIRGHVDDNMHLIRRCFGLRQLCLRWDCRHLLVSWNPSTCGGYADWVEAGLGGYAIISSEELISRYHLTHLLELGSLDSVNLSVDVWALTLRQEAEWCILDAMRLIREVGLWLVREFSNRGRSVAITYENPKPRERQMI